MTEAKPSDEDMEAGPLPTPAGLADERFAVNLREERERQDLSQADIAREMKDRGWKWHPQTVQRVEAGHRKVTIGEAEAIAAILHTTADRLTWPGREASAAALMDMSIGRILSAWEQITDQACSLLWAQRQLAVTLGEAERAGFCETGKIREIAQEAREVLRYTPEGAVEEGREDFARLKETGEELMKAEGATQRKYDALPAT